MLEGDGQISMLIAAVAGHAACAWHCIAKFFFGIAEHHLLGKTAHLAFSRGFLKSFCSLVLVLGLVELALFPFPLSSAYLSCCSRKQPSNRSSRHPS